MPRSVSTATIAVRYLTEGDCETAVGVVMLRRKRKTEEEGPPEQLLSLSLGQVFLFN